MKCKAGDMQYMNSTRNISMVCLLCLSLYKNEVIQPRFVQPSAAAARSFIRELWIFSSYPSSMEACVHIMRRERKRKKDQQWPGPPTDPQHGWTNLGWMTSFLYIRTETADKACIPWFMVVALKMCAASSDKVILYRNGLDSSSRIMYCVRLCISSAAACRTSASCNNKDPYLTGHV